MVGYGPEDDHFVAELTYNYSGMLNFFNHKTLFNSLTF